MCGKADIFSNIIQYIIFFRTPGQSCFMYIYLNKLEKVFGEPIKGLVQVGANQVQEVSHYIQECKVSKLALFEPLPEAFGILKEAVAPFLTHCDVKIYNFALGAETGKANIHVADNDGQSNSILEPTLHLTAHGKVHFEKTISIEVKKMDDVLDDKAVFNCLSLDV